MRRGTTLTDIFNVNVDCTSAELIYITYSQNGIIVCEKTIDDMTITEDEIEVNLSQEDTIKFKEGTFDVQIRVKFPDGRAIASNIVRTSVDKILKEGVI